MIRRPLLALLLAGLAGAASAEMMSVTESASYPMSDEESHKDGRERCVEAAKHTALDRAGSVFEAEMQSDRSESGQDEARLKMRSYFAGVVSSETVGDRVEIDPQGRATETCTVKIGYDPGTVSAKMREIADAEGLRKQVAQQQTTIAGLQDQVRLAQAAAAPAPIPAPVAAAPQYLPPKALVPPLQPYVAPVPAPARAAPAYYPPPAPRPVAYYAPPPPVYYVPVARPRRLRVVRIGNRLYYYRP